KDGYIFTYNQFHFPGKRWINFLIEHELYTLGHLIEAAIAHHNLTKKHNYLHLAEKIGGLLLNRFNPPLPKETPGHQEIEIALIKLYRATDKKEYLELAKQFLEQRGRNRLYPIQMIKEFASQSERAKEVEEQRKNSKYALNKEKKLMSDLSIDKIRFLTLRFYLSALSGKYSQQHKPLLKMKKPVGHSVRFGYYVTASSMLYQETGDQKLLQVLDNLWRNVVEKHLYITGGIGSLPLLEGFGKNYELSNRYAYCETCAAISSVFWSWEMLLNTGKAHFADLMEWQLYNAVLVGMSLNGKRYFYRNPIESNGNYERKEWFRTACCPSNISRTLAKVGEYIYSHKDNSLWIHQYISNETKFSLEEQNQIDCKIGSELPWKGKVKIELELQNPEDFTLHLRIPSWAKSPQVKLNGVSLSILSVTKEEDIKTASGYSPFEAFYIQVSEGWEEKNTLEITFPIDIIIHRAHPKVRDNRGKIALSRGPLVYCFENIDNSHANIPNANIDLRSPIKAKEKSFPKLGKILVLEARDQSGNKLIAIPYFLWGNRECSSMQVWVKTEN
ncbi:MAG: glycoside hydrolase family 127 protein, partial [Candidatus Heimdallarchaeaceae archaeon]